MNIKRSLILALTLFAFINAFAQEAKKVYRPDIPGSFLVDFGVNGVVNQPTKFSIGWFGSKTVNLYYYYPLRFGKSKFSFNPGIGFGFDRYKFKNGYHLRDTLGTGQFALVPNFLKDTTFYPGLKKSLIVMDYFDIPLEFRFNANPDDLARTFWVSVGARAGVLFNAHSKIKYKIDGDNALMKDRQRYGFSQFRYGLSMRVGMGNFNLFTFYNLSPLFEKGKGPSQTTMTSFSLGVSIVGL